MRAVDLIRRKRDGGTLGRDDICAFVEGVTCGAIPDYQAAAMLMAIVLRGMSPDETAALTDAMVQSGACLAPPPAPRRPRADKHSTGGVGDKTSLVVAPVVASCGVTVPMMSGRGLGHTGGTLDKLEAIPGLRTALTVEEISAITDAVGCCIAGQTAEIAPADRALYALRDVTATVDSLPLITASIMSKKIAEGLDALVLDVKCGRGAFMKTEADAAALAESLVATGTRHGVRTEALVTAMDAPLGRAVGHALEVREAVDALQGAGPADLARLSAALAARMLVLCGAAATGEKAAARVARAIDSGDALERFRAMVAAQGGDPGVVDDPSRLPSAPGRETVRATEAGFVGRLDAEAIGRAVVLLGGGREAPSDAVDHAVGLCLAASVGDAVARGDPVLEVHFRDPDRLARARPLLDAAVTVVADPPSPVPLLVRLVSAA